VGAEWSPIAAGPRTPPERNGDAQYVVELELPMVTPEAGAVTRGVGCEVPV
jgi:hypothetical protein